MADENCTLVHVYLMHIVVFVRYLSCESQLGGSLFTKPHDIGYSP